MVLKWTANNWRFRCARAILSLVLSSFIVSCGGGGAPDLSTITLFSVTNQLTPGFILSVYRLGDDGAEDQYVGTLNHSGGNIEWPSVIQAHLATNPTSVRYVVKAYSSVSFGMNGDFYYEAPVLTEAPPFNGAATALWWAIKSSAAERQERPFLSATQFEDALFLLNSACPTCLGRNGGDTYALLASKPSLVDSLVEKAEIPAIEPSVMTDPPVGVAYSNPVALGRSVSLESAQGELKKFEVAYFDPLSSARRIAPDSWAFIIPSVIEFPLAPIASAKQRLNHSFDYDYSGSITISARKIARGKTLGINFNFDVSETPRPPVFAMPSQTFIANHRKRIDLSQYTSDPAGETLTYALVEAPSGATLNGPILEWNPTQYPDSQVGPADFRINISNVSGLTIAGRISATVLPDRYPEFVSSPSGMITVAEGQTGSFAFTSADQDGDLVEISCRSALDGRPCASLFAGANPDGSLVPPGSNWPSTSRLVSPGFYDGDAGEEAIEVPFIPSYYQIPSGTTHSDYPVIFSLNYFLDGSGDIRSLPNPASVPLTIRVTNTADAPVWTVQPGPAPSPAATETIAMDPVPGGMAVDGAINPPPNTITYAIDSVTASPSGTPANCAWISVDPVTSDVTGTPPYTSAAICSVRLRAIDPLGIYSVSSSLAISTVDTPRPIAPTGTIPLLEATENQKLSVNFATYFSAPDFSAQDPRARLRFDCTNCEELGIMGVAFRNSADTGIGTYFTYTPDYAIAPSGGSQSFTGVNVVATLSNGNPAEDRTASQTFDLIVHDAMAPMALTFTSASLNVTSPIGYPEVTLDALSTGTVNLSVANAAGDTSTYPYTLTVECATGCSASMGLLSASTGTGPQTLTLTLSPSASDGYAGASNNFKQHIINIRMAGPNGIFAQVPLYVNVRTIDRPATGMTINGDSGTGVYNHSIDSSNFSDNTLAFSVVSPDASNNTFTYTFETATYPMFGSLSGNSWKFNPLASGCAPGTGTVTKTFRVMGTSNRGGATFTRTIVLTIQNAATGGGGGCPY